MINFNFTLDDIDSQNFVDMLDKHIVNIKFKIRFYKAGMRDEIKDDNHLKWCQSHLKYLEKMFDTIMKSQTRLPSKPVKDNYLQEQIKKSNETYSKWPQWKKDIFSTFLTNNLKVK